MQCSLAGGQELPCYSWTLSSASLESMACQTWHRPQSTISGRLALDKGRSNSCLPYNVRRLAVRDRGNIRNHLEHRPPRSRECRVWLAAKWWEYVPTPLKSLDRAWMQHVDVTNTSSDSHIACDGANTLAAISSRCGDVFLGLV